ncbi:class I SAM-dependent methyltransferase [Nocardia sp. NPDC059691]|uniref:class I SAM-dependent methyltransferase n=1 Tax=Nocardia sp. NPDC059691 TaxID=3346908 RepID=UPI0036A0F4EA
MSETEFDSFFEPYAGNVEGFYEASYWKLADELIKELVRRHLSVESGHHVLDAGGGTGRWALWLAEQFDVEVTVADKSRAMLEEAKRNITEAGVSSVRLTECDLHGAPELPDAGYDALISTYGVLSFLDDPAAAFDTFYRVLKPGGRGLLMSHSLSNAVSSKINRDGADAEEIRELLRTGIVKWAPNVPPLRVYSAQQLRDLAIGAGFTVEGVFGVTCMALPGSEDFGYPYGELSAISKRLEDDDYLNALLEVELAAAERPEWAERGVNLMVKVRR